MPKSRKIRRKTRKINKKRTRTRKHGGMIKKTGSFVVKASQPLATIGKEYLKTKIQDEALQKQGRLSQTVKYSVQKPPTIPFKYSSTGENIYYDENNENVNMSNMNRIKEPTTHIDI
jgi:hypothetical protein